MEVYDTEEQAESSFVYTDNAYQRDKLIVTFGFFINVMTAIKNIECHQLYPSCIRGCCVFSGQKRECIVATRRRVKCSDSMCRQPTAATLIYTHIHT